MAKTQTTLEGGAKPIDWTKYQSPTGGINHDGMSINSNIKFKPSQTITDGGMCLNSEGKKVGCNSLIADAPVKEVVSQDSEDKFWRSLGFTQSDMIKPKHKGRFYLAVALVVGYLAYKKYKK